MPHLETGKEKSEYGKSLTALHISVMLFGLSAVLGRFVDVPAVLVAAGRVVFSSLLLLVILLVKRAPLKLATGKDYAVALLAGAVLAVHWTTFFQSIQSASVAIGTITFSTFPLFLTFLEPLVFHEKLQLRDLLSAAVLLVGVIITVPEFSMENEMTIGMIWGMVSSLSYAVLSLFNRHLAAKYEAKTICLYEQGTAAVVLLPAWFLVAAEWSVSNVLGVAAIGLICTAFAHSLYVSAQKKVKAQTAGIVSGMETVYGIAYALLLLGEVPTVREIVGGALILGTALFSSYSPKDKKTES